MSILDHVISGRKFKPPRIIIYGPEKIGKTTFLSEMPNPISIQTEDGSDEVGVSRFEKCNSYEDMIMYLTALRDDPHKFKTIGLDSLDWAERLIHWKVAETKGKESIEDIGYASGYKIALKYWDDVLNLIDEIMAVRKMAFCGIAHSVIREFHDPAGENYDFFTLNLHKLSVERIKQWADAILFVNYRVYTKVTGEGLNKEVKAKGGDDRVIYCEKTPAFDAGSRFSLPKEVPLIPGQSWNAIAQFLRPKAAETVVEKPKKKSSKSVPQTGEMELGGEPEKKNTALADGDDVPDSFK